MLATMPSTKRSSPVRSWADATPAYIGSSTNTRHIKRVITTNALRRCRGVWRAVHPLATSSTLARTLYGSAAPSNRTSFVEGSHCCYRRRAVRGRPGLSNRSTDLLRHQYHPPLEVFHHRVRQQLTIYER